ncbi:MAG: S1-like domain-containing RNA-binding protein [Lentimicrobium sp.]|jgi:predicted RNA-binding protein (virulence factor B family)|nr:S1-like domain-containing RNA-binding protein [Lentimicrobium sp.]
MAIPGKYNTLSIIKIVDFGVYLDGGELGEILLPMKWVPEGCKPDDEIEVFIYYDSEDRVIATTMKPYAQVGEFALLKAKAVNEIGAFLDWGLEKDLLVPYREQNAKMVEGRSYLVYIYADPQGGRIAASARLERFLSKETANYQPWEEVDLILWRTTDIGYMAVVNNQHEGLLYSSEVFVDLERGQHIKGYVMKVREDGKIDLSLQKPGYEKIDGYAERLLALLKENEGFLELNDKSPAEDIYDVCGMSKKNFKKSIGALYKQKRIQIEDTGIRLIQ